MARVNAALAAVDGAAVAAGVAKGDFYRCMLDGQRRLAETIHASVRPLADAVETLEDHTQELRAEALRLAIRATEAEARAAQNDARRRSERVAVVLLICAFLIGHVVGSLKSRDSAGSESAACEQMGTAQ